jgi:hypothetical protein
MKVQVRVEGGLAERMDAFGVLGGDVTLSHVFANYGSVFRFHQCFGRLHGLAEAARHPDQHEPEGPPLHVASQVWIHRQGVPGICRGHEGLVPEAQQVVGAHQPQHPLVIDGEASTSMRPVP